MVSSHAQTLSKFGHTRTDSIRLSRFEHLRRHCAVAHGNAWTTESMRHINVMRCVAHHDHFFCRPSHSDADGFQHCRVGF